MSPRARAARLLALLLAGCAEAPAPLERGEIPRLDAGVGVEREIAPGETVRYRMPLAAGELVRVDVEQHGVDVVARLRAPGGSVLLEADRMIHEEGPELLAGIAEQAGEHLLELSAWPRPGPPGRISVRLATRPPSPAERSWVERYGALLAVEAQARAGNTEGAIAGYQRLIARARDVELEAEATVRLGESQVALGRWSEAAEAFERAAAVAPADSLWRMLALELLGAARLARAEPAAAVEALEGSLALAERFDHRFRRARCHLFLARARREQGAIQRALDHYQRALGLLRPWELEERASALHGLGVLYHWNLGRPRPALEALGEARGIYRQLGDAARAAATLNQMGAAYETLGERARALDAHGEALTLRHALGERCAEANTLVRLALAAWPDPAAEARARRAQAILAEEPCPRDRTAVLFRLAVYEERAGRSAAAHRTYRESLELYRARGDRAGEALALLGTARVCRRLDDCGADPLELARGALEIFEDTRGELAREDDRIAYGSHSHDIFELLIELEWARGHTREAFASAERARARALRDRLRAIGADPEPARESPIGLAEARRLLAPSTALLVYRLGAARSFLWLAGADVEASFELPPRAEIEAEVERARVLLTSPEPIRGADAWHAEAFRGLAAAVLPPALAPHLAGRRLLVVADGALELIPFAVLPGADDRPLVDDHDIVHLPSVSAWAELRARPARPAPAGLLAVIADPVYGADDPRLGGARREAEAILAAAPATATTRALLGFDATKAAVLGGALDGYRYLHFATHGEIHPRQPALSRLALARLDRAGGELDGDLFAYELYGHDLAAELVVLAGCDTGLGPRIPGEGLVSGLARAFLYAGARRVIVSLWPISDRATPELMARFYAWLLADGDPVRSLHRVQRELYREGRHPYAWAGFVIQGD